MFAISLTPKCLLQNGKTHICLILHYMLSAENNAWHTVGASWMLSKELSLLPDSPGLTACRECMGPYAFAPGVWVRGQACDPPMSGFMAIL